MRNFNPKTKQKLVSNIPTLTQNEQGVWNGFFTRNIRLIEKECSQYFYAHKKDDMAMEIMEHLMKTKDRYEIANERGWIRVVCRNYCLKKLQKRDKKRTIYPIAEEITQCEEMVWEEPRQVYEIATDQDEKEQILKKALFLLKHEQSICVYYRYYEEKTYKEIAKITQFTTQQIKSYIQNGKRNLKVYLLNHGITSAY